MSESLGPRKKDWDFSSTLKTLLDRHTLELSNEELEEINKQDDNEILADKVVYYYADKETNDVIIDGSKFNNKKGKSEIFGISLNDMGLYDIELTMKSDQGALAQLPLSIYYDNALKETITIRGTEGNWITETRELGFVFGVNHYIKLYFGANGLDIDRVVIRFKENGKLPF